MILAFVALTATPAAAARAAGVLDARRLGLWLAPPPAHAAAARSCIALHGHHRRAVPLGRGRCRCAPRPEIFDNPYALPTAPALGASSPTPGSSSNYGTYFWNSTIVVVARRGAGHADRRHGRPLPRPLPLPRQPPRSASSSCRGMILPPQLLILSLFQIMLELRALQLAARARSSSMSRPSSR